MKLEKWRVWENVVSELRPLQDANHGLIPSFSPLLKSNKPLHSLLSSYWGGMDEVRKRLGIYGKKWCDDCQRVLSIDHFRLRSDGKGRRYRNNVCSSCSGNYVETYRRTWRGWASFVVKSIRFRAKKKRIPCTIGKEDVVGLLARQGFTCALTGLPLKRQGDTPRENSTGAYRFPMGPSVDRIIPERGYVPGNVRIVCNWANWSRSDLSDVDFKTLCEAVASHEYSSVS